MVTICECLPFNSVYLSNNDLTLFHLNCVNDVLFMADWSDLNFINQNRLLQCFFIAFRLKLNLHKSKIYGLGVEDLEVARLSSILKCMPSYFPFFFLSQSSH